jgi:hypothetical protein
VNATELLSYFFPALCFNSTLSLLVDVLRWEIHYQTARVFTNEKTIRNNADMFVPLSDLSSKNIQENSMDSQLSSPNRKTSTPGEKAPCAQSIRLHRSLIITKYTFLSHTPLTQHTNLTTSTLYFIKFPFPPRKSSFFL